MRDDRVRADVVMARRMSKPSPNPESPPRVVERTAALWGLAGLIGITLAVTIVMKNPFPQLAMPLCALIGIASGWIAMLLFAPWRRTFTLNDDRHVIARITRDLKNATGGRRDGSLKDLVLDRDDELGALTRVIHDTLARSIADRREARRLQRTMDDSIRRETDRATMRLTRQATTDPLTGLGNRRTMESELDRLFAPDRRKARTNVVAMVIDVDLFKIVNDTLGHDVGDQCLIFLGELLTSTLRRDDCAIRLGGDEFVVLMPNQSLEEARAVGERISSLFGQMPWSSADVSRPTLSMGLATASCADTGAREDLIRRADAALYRSKSAGRGTIRHCDGSHRMPA